MEEHQRYRKTRLFWDHPSTNLFPGSPLPPSLHSQHPVSLFAEDCPQECTWSHISSHSPCIERGKQRRSFPVQSAGKEAHSAPMYERNWLDRKKIWARYLALLVIIVRHERKVARSRKFHSLRKNKEIKAKRALKSNQQIIFYVLGQTFFETKGSQKKIKTFSVSRAGRKKLIFPLEISTIKASPFRPGLFDFDRKRTV